MANPIEVQGSLDVWKFGRALSKVAREQQLKISEARFDVSSREVKIEDGEEILHITTKPIVLMPINDIETERNTYLLEGNVNGENGAWITKFSSHGGMFFDDGDSQTMYYNASIFRIASGEDARKAVVLKSPRVFSQAAIDFNHQDDWVSRGERDVIDSSSTHVESTGEDCFLGIFFEALDALTSLPKD